MSSNNPWRRGSLLYNPYRRNAFRVAGLPPEVTKYNTIVRIISQTKRVIETDANAHTISNEPVTIADVNSAEAILLTPLPRIQEELLQHETESLPLEKAQNCLNQLKKVFNPEDSETSPKVINYKGLELWAGHLVSDSVRHLPAPAPSFGATELALIPPFGLPDQVKE